MTEKKNKILTNRLRDLGSFVVAFSGGVDSAFLLHRAKITNGVNFLGVTITTPYIPAREKEEASAFARKQGINHQFLEISFPISLGNNPSDRCYICKTILFSKLLEFAAEKGYRHVVEGTNADDLHTYRPGLKAIKELGIISPLAEAGLGKEEIRELLKRDGLSLWNKPSMTCLLTRIPYNTKVEEESLKMIDLAETFLEQRGYLGTRVRIHGKLARIECLPQYFGKMTGGQERKNISDYFKKLGFNYISLDLEGYRSGSSDNEISQL